MHNDANVIAFGAEFMRLEEIVERIEIFSKAQFLGLHHCERITQINSIEEKQSCLR